MELLAQACRATVARTELGEELDQMQRSGELWRSLCRQGG
jgi:hypothetical protein